MPNCVSVLFSLLTEGRPSVLRVDDGGKGQIFVGGLVKTLSIGRIEIDRMGEDLRVEK